MRSPLRYSSGLLLALTLLASSASASAAATPDAGSADNNNNNNLDNFSPFLPGLALNNDPNLYQPAALAPNQPTPTAAGNNNPNTPTLPSPTTTPAPPDPFWQIHDLKKRQLSSSSSSGGTTCPSSYSACAALGAPGLCCRANSNCAVDQAGHVACCPDGAVCTGSISASRTVGSGVVVTTVSPGASSASSATTTGTSQGGGFIIVASTTVAQPNGAGLGRRGLIPGVGWFL